MISEQRDVKEYSTGIVERNFRLLAVNSKGMLIFVQ